MNLDKQILVKVLTLLGERLESEGCPCVHLVVSGGSALLAGDIVSRSTHDVDVLAVRGEVDGELGPAWPLPEIVRKHVPLIAELYGLAPNWLNSTTSLMMIGLNDFPQEAWTGLETQEFGESLKVTFMGRIGLIYLKAYARANRNEIRDLSDLKALAPTEEEAGKVARWLFEEGLASRINPKPVFEMLVDLGHENIVSRIESELK